jgi:nitrogen fixation protein NifU and related proteins
MPDLKDLYQDALLDHYKKPRNHHKPDHANRQAEGFNPLCGDKICVYLNVEDGIIRDIGFDGMGCAISIAAASMMTESVKGKTEDEAKKTHDNFLHLLTNRPESHSQMNVLGNLISFSSVRDYPVRVKCATLSWHTLRAALEGNPETITTE